MRIFISGPMSGYTDWNFPMFARAEDIVRAQGHWPISMRMIVEHDMNGNTSLPWDEYISKAMLFIPDCDALMVLPNWESSVGAFYEVAAARKLGIPIFSYAFQHVFTAMLATAK